MTLADLALRTLISAVSGGLAGGLAAWLGTASTRRRYREMAREHNAKVDALAARWKRGTP